MLGTCAYAAQGGQLEVLKWAHENGCYWNSQICAYAAHGGHLELLKWARANGCEWEADRCMIVARDEATKQWIRENSEHAF